MNEESTLHRLYVVVFRVRLRMCLIHTLAELIRVSKYLMRAAKIIPKL